MVHYWGSVLTGVLICVMIAFNGGLSDFSGVYPATVLIHIVGLLTILPVLLIAREPLMPRKRIAPALYLGGVYGMLTTIFNNISFATLSVSALLALGLLGQSITSAAIDQFGLFGCPKVPFEPRKIAGLLLVALGAGLMIFL